jgi:uncharacterized protein YggE
VLLSAYLFSVTLNALKENRFIGSGIGAVNIVSVSGEGEVFAVPDTAEFTFSITEEGATAGAVQETATTKANEVIDALKAQGVEEKDIKTVAYELHPKYEWIQERCTTAFGCPGKQVQNGFELTQSVLVKARDLNKAGELLSLVTEKNVSNVSGLTFTIADEDGLRAEARKAAIDDAKEKAEKLATDLGVSLVRIVSFNENEGNYPMPYMARDMAMSDVYGIGGGEEAKVASVPAGENRISSNVSVTYEIR